MSTADSRKKHVVATVKAHLFRVVATQIFFIFHAENWGEAESILTSIFSKGLKAPTSISLRLMVGVFRSEGVRTSQVRKVFWEGLHPE